MEMVIREQSVGLGCYHISAAHRTLEYAESCSLGLLKMPAAYKTHSKLGTCYVPGQRRNTSQWAEKLGCPVTLRTAALVYFEELGLLQNPILLEYGELKKLRYNAATDPLTGLNNRRMFKECLDQEIEPSTRYGFPFALLFDLYKFKNVNDTYGHAAGDELLRSVARASLETIRGSDIPCRIGGDEFATFLPRQTGPAPRC